MYRNDIDQFRAMKNFYEKIFTESPFELVIGVYNQQKFRQWLLEKLELGPALTWYLHGVTHEDVLQNIDNHHIFFEALKENSSAMEGYMLFGMKIKLLTEGNHYTLSGRYGRMVFASEGTLINTQFFLGKKDGQETQS